MPQPTGSFAFPLFSPTPNSTALRWGEEAVLSDSDMARRLSDGAVFGAWFEEYGREPGAIRTGDDYYGEILMRLPLAHR